MVAKKKWARVITPGTPRIEKYDDIDMDVKLVEREGRLVLAASNQ